ncbi:MAG: hypothetical protein LUD19_02030, partial [Clostridia bacterium]|nr:hypothetical protein [Clostridia bacterium]
DKREPDVEMVKRISRLLDVSADWLIGNASTEGNLPFSLDITEIKIVKKYRSLDAYGQRAICELLETEHERCTQQDTQTSVIELPFSLLKASAGTGNWLDEEQMDTICVVATSTARKADIVIEVSGESMKPQLNDGDKILVRLQPAVELGETGVFIVDGNGYVKQYSVDRLISVNPEWDDIVPSEYSEVKCIGKVLGKAKMAE